MGGLRVEQSGVSITGGLTIHSSGLRVLASGASITGGLTVASSGAQITGGLTVSNSGIVVQHGLTVSSNGARITGGLFVTGGLTVYGYANKYASSSAWNWDTSDRRLKTEVAPLGSTLSKISRLRGVYFKWGHTIPANKYRDQERTIGLIAQEVEKMFPEIVSKNYLGYSTVNYVLMIPVLLEAIRELNEQMKDIDAEMTEIRDHLGL